MTDFAAHADDDRDLLRRYAVARDQAAFAALVGRYSGLVHGTAMRRTGEAEWAADITQNVFAALAAKAPALVRQGIPSVGAWLHRAATFEAKRHTRDQLNARRRQAMIEDKLKTLTEIESERAWSELRPRLDKALEKLPARDREVIILHYFDGLKFGEIGQRLGMRPDAAQKSGLRALEKLARLLGSRTVASVTVATLAAGLSSELCRAAPSALLPKLGALAAAVSGTTKTSTLMSAMTLSTKSTVAGTLAVALVILTATLGGGYLVGNATRSEPPNKEVIAEASAPRVTTSPSPVVASATPDEAEKERGRIEAMVARLRTMAARREALMRKGNSLKEQSAGFEDFRPLMAEIDGIMEAALAETSSLSAKECAEAMALLGPETDDATNAWLVSVLLEGWAASDPRGALAEAEKTGGNLTAAVFRGWGASDPREALAYQAKLAETDQSAARAALYALFQGWAFSSPGEAVAALEGFGFDARKQITRAFASALKLESRRAEVLAAVSAVKENLLRSELVEEVGSEWAEFQPLEAMGWLDTVAIADEADRARIAAEIFQEVAKAGHARAGADWLWPKLSAPMRVEFVRNFVTRSWLSREPEEATAWMRAHGIEQQREVAP